MINISQANDYLLGEDTYGVWGIHFGVLVRCSISWMLHGCSLYNHLLYLKFMVFTSYLAYVLYFITYKKRVVN